MKIESRLSRDESISYVETSTTTATMGVRRVALRAANMLDLYGRA